MISFSSKSRCFYVTATGQKLRGLHGVLEQKFYPAGSTQDAIQKRSRKTFQHGPRKIKRGIKGAVTMRKAKNYGKRVDEQIKRMVEYADQLAEKKKSQRGAILRHWTQSDEDKTCMDILRSMFGKKMPKYPSKKKPEDATIAAIRTLVQSDWIPKRCQVPVGSATHGLATAVDIECEHANKAGQIAVVELKVGYNTTWKSDTNQHLNKPLDMLRDSPENKAHLQALCTAMLYRESEKPDKTPTPLVLHVSDQGAKLHPLLPDILQHTREIGQVFASH